MMERFCFVIFIIVSISQILQSVIMKSRHRKMYMTVHELTDC
jgi:uncharacterized membrane protein